MSKGARYNFALLRSKNYCDGFFNQLNDQDRIILLSFLSEFASQPFIRAETVTSDLLSKVFFAGCVYLYWVNDSLRNQRLGETHA